jgi:hypothetical protein
METQASAAGVGQPAAPESSTRDAFVAYIAKAVERPDTVVAVYCVAREVQSIVDELVDSSLATDGPRLDRAAGTLTWPNGARARFFVAPEAPLLLVPEGQAAPPKATDQESWTVAAEEATTESADIPWWDDI